MSDKITLADGSEVDRRTFDGLETKLLEDDPESFQENRLETRKESDNPSPFTATSSFTTSSIARERHQERTQRAQTADENYNAPIAPDYRTWRKNPQRYDLPGIDTIPAAELAARGRRFVETAQEQGIVDELEFGSLGGSRRGEFNAEFNADYADDPDVNEYDTGISVDADDDPDFLSFGEGSVLAHETGHALDFDASAGNNFRSQRAFFSRTEGDTFNQAYDLSERVRGSVERSTASYREDERELIADSIASIALEPRAARREAPELFDAIEEQIGVRAGDSDESFFGEVFGGDRR